MPNRNLNIHKIFRALLRSWPAKALSLTGALVLFLFHRTNTLDSRSLAVPLVIENAGALVAVNNYPRTVTVTFRGHKKFMDTITENDVAAALDALRCDAPGVYTLPVGLVKKGNALAAGPLEMRPDPWEVTLELDALTAKTVPVNPVFTGTLPEGYHIVSSAITPQTLRISGPESLLKKTGALFTGSISLDGRTGPFSVAARIMNKEPLLQLIGGTSAEFSADVRPVPRLRRVDGIPLSLWNLRSGFTATVTPESASLMLQIEEDAEPLPDTAPALYADCSAIETEGAYRLPLHASPENADIFSIIPPTVEIFVTTPRRSAD